MELCAHVRRMMRGGGPDGRAARRPWRAGRLAWAAAVAAVLSGPLAHAGTPAEPDAVQQPAQPQPQRLPLEHFARLPMLGSVSISPDGTRLAALMNRGGETILVTRSLADGGLRVLMKSSEQQKFHLRWVHWVGNERLLASVVYPSRRGFVGTVETRLTSVRVEDAQPKLLMPAGLAQQIQDDVIDWMRDDGRHVLVQLHMPNVRWPSVFKLNVETGAHVLVHGAEKGVRDWVTDAQHRVRAAVRWEEKGQPAELIVRDPEGGPWRTLWTFSPDKEPMEPLGFGADPQELWMLAPHEGRAALFSVRLDEPGTPRTLRLAHPVHDIEGSLMREPSTKEVVGLRGMPQPGAAEGERSELWDEGWRALVQAVDRSLPERDNVLLQISDDGSRYLVFSSGPRQPGEYYVGDRESGRLSLLGQLYPELSAQQLAGKQVVRIQARDGLPLTAYLTRPLGAAQGPRPMVLLPHGGPQGRDDAGFDAWSELLANRGYTVLQVNFRGSSGYGSEFLRAGLHQWGGRMQDDLQDAVQWAVAQGVADPVRICIVGGSYGGYAALMGVVKTPRLYRCAVSFAGVSDLTELAQHWEDYLDGRVVARRMLGDWWDDRERLRATSPALHAARIEVPVLLVHGSEDRRVPVSQSRAMASALSAAGRAYRYVEQPGGDHHLSRQSDRTEFMRELEAFLAQHLAP